MKKHILIWILLKLNPPGMDGKPTCKKGSVRFRIYEFVYSRLLKVIRKEMECQ